MSTTGREVASGTLWMNKGDHIKIRARVVARCGTPDCSYEGQIVIYEESQTLGGGTGIVDIPSRVLRLSTIAEVSSLNGSHPTTPSVSPPVLGMSLEGHTPLLSSSLWGMMFLLTTGEAVELFADTREQQQQWIQYLTLLSMFPYSPIPEEPRNNPIRNTLRSKLKSSNYDADSVWLVYVLAEEVGSRVQALGVHIITLKSSLMKGSPAQMSIISPLDSEPIVTWDANRMRRTGSLGNMVFIEIGRRCEGGPGLIWMYACQEDSDNYRDTLKRFLFIGDGRPANTNTVTTTSFDKSGVYNRTVPHLSVSSSASSSPSSSGGSSFKLSFNGPAPTVVKKCAEYDSADVDDVNLQYDYAFNTGPYNRRHSTIPLSSTPPPINLVSHPSRKKEVTQHRRSLSIPGKTTNTVDTVADNKLLFHSSTDSGLASTISLEDDFQSIDESLSQIMSDLNDTTSNNNSKNDDGLSDLIAQLECFATSDKKDITQPVIRSNTLPSGQTKPVFRRANSTSTCQPMHYLRVRNPKADLMNDGYIMMGSGGHAHLDKVPEEKNTILTKKQTNEQDVYINHPLPHEVATATPILYQREYHNITHDNNNNSEAIYENNDDCPIYENNDNDCPIYDSTNNNQPIYENNDDDETIYMNHDQTPATDSEMKQLFSSAWSEIDNLQLILNQFSVTD